MEKVICDDWALSENGHWDRDERHRRNLFRDGETRHSHGSYPQTDSLSFYLSYHAMMIVAGKLLATVPRHQDLTILTMSLRDGSDGICSLSKMATGWLIEEILHHLSGRVGKTMSKKMIGAGP